MESAASSSPENTGVRSVVAEVTGQPAGDSSGDEEGPAPRRERALASMSTRHPPMKLKGLAQPIRRLSQASEMETDARRAAGGEEAAQQLVFAKPTQFRRDCRSTFSDEVLVATPPAVAKRVTKVGIASGEFGFAGFPQSGLPETAEEKRAALRRDLVRARKEY